MPKSHSSSTGIHAAVMYRLGQKRYNVARLVTVVFSLFLLAGVVWATHANVPGLVRATGELTADGPLRVVEHLDGGLVATIEAREGDQVAAGDVLATLGGESLKIQISQVMQRKDLADRRISRLNALLEAFPSDPTAADTLPRADENLALQQAQVALGMARRRAAGLTIREQAEAIRALRAIRDAAQHQVRIAERQAERLRRLRESGLVTASALDAQSSEVAALRRDYLTAESEFQSGRTKLSDAQAAYDELILSEREARLEALDIALSERDEAAHTLDDLLLRQERLSVRSPVDGIVQSIGVSVLGAVVEPGGLVAEILPTNVSLIAEVRLSPNDVGQISTGDDVSLTVTTFDRKRYGQITGTINTISATSLSPPNEDPYFKVVVNLDSQSIGEPTISQPLRAGMTVQAEIVTNARTVAQYLLKPLDTSLAVTMTEK